MNDCTYPHIDPHYHPTLKGAGIVLFRIITFPFALITAIVSFVKEEPAAILGILGMIFYATFFLFAFLEMIGIPTFLERLLNYL